MTGYEWQTEYKFNNNRKWRFDFALPEKKLAVEIDGGIWTNGRHVRGSGFLKDMEKLNSAVELGWKVLRYEKPEKIIEYKKQIEKCM